LKNHLKAGRKAKALWFLVSTAWIALLILFSATGGVPALLFDNAKGRNIQDVLATSVSPRNLKTGLLTLGMPPLSDRVGCIFCRLSRESGVEFTAVEHPNGGPSRILLMRHANDAPGGSRKLSSFCKMEWASAQGES